MLQAINRLKDYVLCARALGPNPGRMAEIFWRETKNIRVRLKMGSYHPTQVYALQTVYGPLHFRDNFGDVTNLANLFYRQVYRLRALPEEGVILDVGANIGLAAAWFAFHNPGRPIHCFEPLAANAAVIRLNCPHARVVEAAVGSRRDRVRLNVDPDQVMASSIPCRWQTKEVEFDVLPLDEYVAAQAIDGVALLKIDAEGMEVEILKGAQATLPKICRVAMETHGEATHAEVLRLLGDAGFHIDAAEFEGSTGMVFASRPQD
jgi:FkbM family methyltransferase